MAYYVGSLARLSAVFTDTATGALADPTTVTLMVIEPDGTSVTYSGTIVHDSVGKFHYDLLLTQTETWLYEWQGAGAVVAVQPGSLKVSAFPTMVSPRLGPVTWTYSFDPANSALDEIRFLISDTDQTKPWTLQDGEINYAVSLYSANPPVAGDNLTAAAVCAETILAKLKGTVADKKVGDLSITYNQTTLGFYEATAYRLRQRATLKKVRMHAGGTSISEKQALDQDPDRVQPAGKVDGMDNASPLSPLPGDQF